MYETNFNYVLFKLFNWNMFNYEGGKFSYDQNNNSYENLEVKIC